MTNGPALLDLFSGAAGGWSLGMHRAGFCTIAACEADPWRRAAFAQNFPDARLYDDVRTLTASRIISDFGALPDIIVGSPPCQDASSANTKGRGVDGERTGLFFEAVRLVGECRPRWAAFENVPGLRNRGADRVLGALEALGYAAEAHVVGAADLGANHERKRVWFIAFDPAQVGHDRRGPWRHGPHGNDAAYSVSSNEPDPLETRRTAYARASVGSDLEEAKGQAAFGAFGDGSYADINRQSHGSVDAEMGWRESARGASEEPWAHWNGGLASHLRLDDGLSARVAPKGGARNSGSNRDTRAGEIVAAFGDSVCPQITEAIGRAIWRVEAALAAVMEAA